MAIESSVGLLAQPTLRQGSFFYTEPINGGLLL